MSLLEEKTADVSHNEDSSSSDDSSDFDSDDENYQEKVVARRLRLQQEKLKKLEELDIRHTAEVFAESISSRAPNKPSTSTNKRHGVVKRSTPTPSDITPRKSLRLMNVEPLSKKQIGELPKVSSSTSEWDRPPIGRQQHRLVDIGNLEKIIIKRRGMDGKSNEGEVTTHVKNNCSYQWYYKGQINWYKYKNTKSDEIEAAFLQKSDSIETVIAGITYVIDIKNLVQYQKECDWKRREIKRDVVLDTPIKTEDISGSDKENCTDEAGTSTRRRSSRRIAAATVKKEETPSEDAEEQKSPSTSDDTKVEIKPETSASEVKPKVREAFAEDLTDAEFNEQQHYEAFLTILTNASYKTPVNVKPDATDFNSFIERWRSLESCEFRKVVASRIVSMAVCPSEDITLVAAGDKWGNMGLWNVNQGADCGDYSFTPHSAYLGQLRFAPNNPALLYSSSRDGSLRCLDLQKQILQEAIVYDYDDGIPNFDFHSADVFVMGSGRGDILTIDRREKKQADIYSASSKAIKCVSVHPLQKDYFAVTGADRLVNIFDMRHMKKNLKAVASLKEGGKTMDVCHFSPITGNKLLTCGYDDRLRIYDTSNISAPKLVSTCRHDNNTGRWLSNFRPMWSPLREDTFVIGNVAAKPRRIEFYDSNLKLRLNLMDDSMGYVTCIHAFHPTKNILFGGNSSGKVVACTAK